MLTAAVTLTTIAVLLGLWLSTLHLIREEPPLAIPVSGMVHGAAGTAAVVLLLVALQGSRRGVHTGAGGFGWTAFALMVLALAGGATILAFHVRKRGAPALVIAMHAMLGIAGGVMLSAWWASPVNVGQ